LADVLLIGAISLESDAQTKTAKVASVGIIGDVPYQPDGEIDYERERNKLELYLPGGRNGSAAISQQSLAEQMA
jgi:hypothetical protein